MTVLLLSIILLLLMLLVTSTALEPINIFWIAVALFLIAYSLIGWIDIIFEETSVTASLVITTSFMMLFGFWLLKIFFLV